MYASFVDLRKKSREIIRALSRNERVTVLYRGKPAAIMHPIDDPGDAPKSAKDHAAFGLWKQRDDLADPSEQVRSMRRGRFDDL
jgi:antitoxin (DNA-binding transcriptional repressor) of toxin-antitoxin stability system